MVGGKEEVKCIQFSHESPFPRVTNTNTSIKVRGMSSKNTSTGPRVWSHEPYEGEGARETRC